MAFMDWRHMSEILAAGTPVFGELKHLAVWDKVNGGMGSFYRSQHELIFMFKNGSGANINNIELGRHGRYRTNVLRYPGASMFRKGRRKSLEIHPTVKPIGLIADLIKDCSHRGGVILDPFGGSGTTMLACERTGRRGRLIEIDPHYVDASIRRWEEMTGRSAILESAGQTFDEVAASRMTTGESSNE
jgi:DNA modification methylase